MARQAIFGPPLRDVAEGGALITCHVVPVYEGRLLAFDIHASEVRGRWLPWTTMDFGGNPYETASELADEWCGGAIRDLRLVDVMSFTFGRAAWELAIVFRADLTVQPAGSGDRKPSLYPAGAFDAIGAFDPIDLERWVVGDPAVVDAPARRGDENPPGGGERLVF